MGKALAPDNEADQRSLKAAVAGEPHPYDEGRRTRLQIGHIVDKSMGGKDEAGNLRAVCSVCNEGARNLTLDRPSLQKLLIQIRRATGADQLESATLAAEEVSHGKTLKQWTQFHENAEAKTCGAF